MSSSRRRVVITGLGVVSPLGNGVESVWTALAEGNSGVGPLTAFSPASLPVDFAAEAWDFKGEINDFGALSKEQKRAIRKGLRLMCRECQMGVAAAQMALADAGVSPGVADPERVGAIYGSDFMLTVPEEFNEGVLQCLDAQGQFDFSRWAADGLPCMSPLWLLKYLPNMPASHIAIYNDLRGPNNSITMREAGANVALGEAYWTIVRGWADMMVAGATGTRIHPMKTVHAVGQEELATGYRDDPAGASRPFDRDRSGMVLGEGAGAVLVEELASAQSRGAPIYGEIVGSASASAAEGRLVARRDWALRNVLVATLKNAGARAEDVGHIHAHGLATRTCDREEAWAVDQVFGQRKTPVPVTAAKSYFGNLGAGGGVVETICSLLALRHDRLFPILNYQTPDPECPIAAVGDGHCDPGGSFINLNVTPQGQASAVMIRRFG
ncbi:MAG: beta-ketoacyl-[acyl-carrier-protein] synthase family protein [Planctomycetes bacterium]|nr:beta-ketoacyl-[acyl-carrier-protein] synthase family protein [Planctomycetota bacterium]